jgi:hypothetical protein
MKHDANRFDFFQLMFRFLSQEDLLNPDEINELIEQYLSPQQKQGVMTTYQLWKIEGRQEGKQEKARLTVLRGKWNNWSAESLADQAELPLSEVNNLLNGYDNVYKLWLKNKGKATKAVPEIEHLSKQEVSYLLAFFTQKHQANSDN